MTSSVERPVNERRFYSAFLAALTLTGVSYVDTRDDVHHKYLTAALEELARQRETGSPAAAHMPRTLTPSMYTGRYAAWDAALLNAQRAGRSGARNPFYLGAELRGTDTRMKSVLERFSPSQQELFICLARVYAKAAGYELDENHKVTRQPQSVA